MVCLRLLHEQRGARGKHRPPLASPIGCKASVHSIKPPSSAEKFARRPRTLLLSTVSRRPPRDSCTLTIMSKFPWNKLPPPPPGEEAPPLISSSVEIPLPLEFLFRWKSKRRRCPTEEEILPQLTTVQWVNCVTPNCVGHFSYINTRGERSPVRENGSVRGRGEPVGPWLSDSAK